MASFPVLRAAAIPLRVSGVAQKPKALFANKAAHAQALKFHRKIATYAAEADEAVMEDDVEEEMVGQDETWAAQRLAALNAAEYARVEDAQYALNFLWLDKNIAVSVDQVLSRGHRSPVTEYFFWPRKDAWEELKSALEEKSWIGERERVLLLNRCTEVINYWQDENKHSLAEASAKFEDCKFFGA